MTTETIWPAVQRHAWKYTQRPDPRVHPISILLVHATRSGIRGRTSAQDYSATKNWFMSAGNRFESDGGGVYAGMTNKIIGDGGKLCVAVPEQFTPTYSAGHIDPIAISYEVAQATNDTPFDPLDLERLETELANDAKRYGIPARHIEFLSGDNRERPGIAYHDGSANGRAWGKSDPGPMFGSRIEFAARVRAAMEGNMPTAEYEELFDRDEAIKTVLKQVNDRAVAALTALFDLATFVYGDNDARTLDVAQRLKALEDDK